MARVAPACPDEEILLALLLGTLTPTEQRDCEQHLDECDLCRRTVALLMPISLLP